MLHLYDTRTRTAQAISPMDGKTLRFYCCGPTVYGPAHIGNFRTFVMQDVFRRVLELGGGPTTHIRNLTDVDDKTIRDSQKAGVSLAEFTAGWADLFHRDCAALNCLPPHAEPSAVGHIPEQIRMVQTLVEKGHAYVSEDGSVYFRISSFPEYGRLSHLDERELDLGKTANTRSNADEYEKDSVADFVLWKSRRPEDGDNFWTSPWGEGRPGWHLECSAMIHKYFGNDFDLHSGGVDLVFPHHENEVAQSRCACGGGFARLWFHITHLLVDGGKMPKSAAANLVEYTEFFAPFAKEYDAVIHISVSSKLSSCFQNARLAAGEFENVCVVDSQNICTGQGYLVLKAAKWAADGLTARAIQMKLQSLAKRVELSFVLDRLDFMAKSGRCSGVLAFGANLLGIKPALEVINGELKVVKKYRGSLPICVGKYITDRLVERDDIEDSLVFISSCQPKPGCMDAVKAGLKKYGSFKECHETDIGTTIGGYSGPGTIGIVFARKEK